MSVIATQGKAVQKKKDEQPKKSTKKGDSK